MQKITVVAHNMRSTHNIGSLFRTCDGLGIEHIVLTGYTAYPAQAHDTRLPHLVKKLSAQIHKTALGAEDYVQWTHTESLRQALDHLKSNGYRIVALEQSDRSTLLGDYNIKNEKIALVLGTERDGLSQAELELCEDIIEIPMLGKKESLNVVQAAAIALYVLSQPLKI